MILAGRFVLSPLALVLVASLVLAERGRRRPVAERDTAAAGHEERLQSWLYRLAVLAGVAVLVTPLDGLARTELFARSLVDVALAWLVAPLLVLGAPWQALRAGLGRRSGPASAGPASAGPAGAGAGRPTPIPGQPFVGVAAVLGTFWLWQVPPIADASVQQVALRAIEHASFLVAGVLLWSELVSSRPFGARWSPLGRTTLIVAALAGTWPVAAAMVYSPTSWYPAFSPGAHPFLPGAASQELAGAFAWALPSIPLGVATFWCFSRWLEQEEEDEATLRELRARAIPAPGRSTWAEGDR